MDTRLLAVKSLIRFFTDGDSKIQSREYNDLFCLFLSQLVYFSPEFIIKYLGKLGEVDVQLIDYDGPTAVCINFDGVSYVSVKGLSGRNKEEWPIVLNFIPKRHAGVEAHGGFVTVTRRLLPNVRAFLNSYIGQPIVLTGHSMGGAIATLASLSVEGCKVVTFGSPKSVATDTPITIDMTHYCIDSDLVTYLPVGLYERPGIHIVKNRAFNLLRLWDSHKLYTYSTFMVPVIAEAPLALLQPE